MKPFRFRSLLLWIPVFLLSTGDVETTHAAEPDSEAEILRVFIFAGQSNMEGADSKAKDIQRFPPFVGLELPQEKVLFSYNIGREVKLTSNGWVALQPVRNLVGPELSFARKVSQELKAPIAVIKCAAGGTTLATDWNPDEPSGFKLYPLALQLVQASMADLDQKKIPYRIEGFMWHQGENDMFNKEFKAGYGRNLKNFLACWRRDLKTPDLKFYIGEHCTKTIWGMDNRANMYAIREGQKFVTESDPLAEYVPTSHNAVEIGREGGLHYHYGTLGQLEHGLNYAEAYLKTIGKKTSVERPLTTWPYAAGSKVKLFILAGHRNMEGERAFTKELQALDGAEELAQDNHKIAFKYSLGGGFKSSKAWEPLGPAGCYDTFGPELSFGKRLQEGLHENIAIAKFTHSGSQINDWTPQGTEAKDRNLYASFIIFVQESIKELEAKGQVVEPAGIFYHLGENDMAFGPYRKQASKWLRTTVEQSRRDLELPSLKWYVSQQRPSDSKDPRQSDPTAELAAMTAADSNLIHLKFFDLPTPQEKLVITTEGVVRLGSVLAEGYLEQFKAPKPDAVGSVSALSQGLHGYIGFGHEPLPVDGGYSAGMGFYAAVWPLTDQPLADFQIGLPSSWIQPDNSDNRDKPLAPEGTLARTWKERGPTWSSVFQTVEGGLGYWAGNHFRYGPPKFSMNATPQCYDYEVGSPGWSFFYSNEALPDNRLGIAQLSNRLLIPPDGLPFQGRPNGEFLGYTWMALPFTDATNDEPPTGDQSWTCFLCADNFKGPIAYYIPETWSKIGKLFNYPFIYGRGLDSRPGNMGGGAMEINTVPRFDSKDSQGTTFTKLPKLQFPVDAEGRAFLVQDVTYYSKKALYDDFKDWRDGGPACSGKLDVHGAWKPKLNTRTTRYDQAGKKITGVEKVFDTRVFEGNVWGLQWDNNEIADKGLFPQYYKHVGNERVAVPAADVPAETKLLDQEFKQAEPGAPYTSPSVGAWATPGPKLGPFSIRLVDGSVVTYSWYRFVDQPSFQQYHWTNETKTKLQAFVEKLHGQWPINRDYMSPPTRGKLVSLDPALIVVPPPGLEVGYVPIVTKQEPMN